MSSRRVQIVVAALEGVIDNIIKKIVLDVVANLKSSPTTGYGTPVDTGWARANWIPRIGVRQVNATGAKEAVNLSQAIQEQATADVIINYRLDRGAVFVSNAVPYITQLNEGSSSQAPRAFVQRAIRKAVDTDLFGRVP